MKQKTLFQLSVRLFFITFFTSCLALTPWLVNAENYAYSENTEDYSHEELSQMLAPIALYPDALLSQVLMASTYPIEVVEADRWLRQNMDLKGDALDAALLDMDWDPSVKAMCHFPSILFLMSERISETTDLGNAFLAQESEVMDTVQELRAKAYAQGNLVSNSQQTVIMEPQTIIIEPANPRVVYVPYYDPLTVYGRWWYPSYQPDYWSPSGVSIGFGVSYWPGFYLGFTFGNWSHFDWHRHSIYIDAHRRPRFVRHDRWIKTPGRWQHRAEHRRGVPYRSERLHREHYGNHSPYSRDTRINDHRYPNQNKYVRDQREKQRFKNDRVNQKREQQAWNKKKQEQFNHQKQEQHRNDWANQDRLRTDRDKKQREQFNRQKQGQQRNERTKQDRLRAERDKKQREQFNRQKQEQQRNERSQQNRMRAEKDKKQREEFTRQQQEQRRNERAQQDRMRAERDKKQREQFNRQQQAKQQDHQKAAYNRSSYDKRPSLANNGSRVSQREKNKDSDNKGRGNGDDRDQNKWRLKNLYQK